MQWLSSKGGLISGYFATIRYAQGLLYSSNGRVVDPEQSVVVGRFEFPDSWFVGSGAAVAPDPSGGRVYFATYSGILIFDINTRVLLGRLPINLGSNIFNSPSEPREVWSRRLGLFDYHRSGVSGQYLCDPATANTASVALTVTLRLRGLQNNIHNFDSDAPGRVLPEHSLGSKQSTNGWSSRGNHHAFSCAAIWRALGGPGDTQGS